MGTVTSSARHRPTAAMLRACTAAVVLALAACGAESPESLIASGKAYAAKRDFKAAAIQYKTALQQQPNSGEARFLLGQALFETGDAAGAAAELARALDQKYPEEQVLPPLARAMFLNGEYKKLTTLYGEKALGDPKANASLKSSIASAWGAQGDAEKTQQAIDAALTSVPEFAPAQLLQARAIAGRRDYPDATKLVDALLARDPSMHEAWMLKGEMSLVQKDPKAAEASFKKALDAQRAYVPAHMALINLRLADGDVAGAKTQLEQMRAAAPNHPVTTFAHAQVLFRSGELTQARELTQQLLRMAPASPAVLLLAGAIEAQGGSLVLAERQMSTALQAMPDLVPARINLAQVYLRLGQPDKALEILRPLLDTQPGAEGFAQAQALAGEAEFRLGRLNAAEARFRNASSSNPGDSRFATALALTRLSRGDTSAAFADLASLAGSSKEIYADQAIVSARMQRKEFDAALAAVDGMASKQPNSAGVFLLRGRVQEARNELKASRAAFEQALRLDPALFDATASLADLDVADGKPEAARQRLEASIQSDPQNVYARLALARLEIRTGATLDQLRTTLNEAISVAPGAAEPRLVLIDLLLKKRQYKDALSQARDAIAALPNDAMVLDAVGRAQLEAGDGEQSINTFRRLAGLLPNNEAPYVRLAEVYKATGRREAAETAYKQALELRPLSKAAQDGLLQLLASGNKQQELMALGQSRQRADPTEAFGYLLEATSYFLAKNINASVAVYRKGLAKVAEGSGLAKALYGTLAQGGRAAEAERFAAEWLKSHPEDMEFAFETANAASMRGEFELAEVGLRRVLARQAQNPLVLNNLAWILAKLKKAGAVELAQHAVNLAPAQAVIVDTLAFALASDDQAQKALAAQKRAVELSPADDNFRLNLARIAVQAGDKELARKELERLRSLGTAFARQDEVAKLSASL